MKMGKGFKNKTKIHDDFIDVERDYQIKETTNKIIYVKNFTERFKVRETADKSRIAKIAIEKKLGKIKFLNKCRKKKKNF